MKSLVVTFVEGLGTSLVGAYGANTARTPTMDWLAARGIVLDQCFLDSVCLEKQLTSLWTGRHALQPEHTGDNGWTLWKHLEVLDIDACLITDSDRVAAQAEKLGCKDVIYAEPLLTNAPCEDNEECALAGVFAAAAEELSAGREGLVWVHSQGLRLPWDAPLSLRSRFADPDDPEPPSEVGPPEFVVTPATDPDQITGWGQVAAAQTAVLDQALAALMNVVSIRGCSDSFSWMLGSLGGVSLGENQFVGFDNPRPHTEQFRIVAILCAATSRSVGKRHAELCQLPDLCPSVLELLGAESPQLPMFWGVSCLGMQLETTPENWPLSHQLAVLSTDTWQWIRCPAWSAVLEAGKTQRMFVKPDDRWEVCNVANLRLEVTEQIEACYQQFLAAIQLQQRSAWPKLSEELTNLLR